MPCRCPGVKPVISEAIAQAESVGGTATAQVGSIWSSEASACSAGAQSRLVFETAG